MATVGIVTEFLEVIAPLSLAAEWDNVGLLLGSREMAVDKIMTCLTVTPDVAEEAAARGAKLIVSHHPIWFKPVQRLTADSAEGNMLLELARRSVAIYSPHTALDNAPGGINDGLARRLGLTGVRPLRSLDGPRHCKIVVFVPETDLALVSEAMFAAGAGNIGQYSQCSFRTLGTGTFFGSDAANPTVGVKGRREDVSEWRLEAVCPEALVNEVLRAMRAAHSYEEPAYDVIPLRPDQLKHGQGRLGTLPRSIRLTEFAGLVKNSLGAASVQTVGPADRMVRLVALACGSAGEFLRDARRAGADVFLTGEMRFHDCLAARSAAIAVVLPGHYASERPGVEDLAQRLAAQFPQIECWPSAAEYDPLG